MSQKLLNGVLQESCSLVTSASTQPDLIAKLIYVDNIVARACDEDKVYVLYETSRKIMMEGAFNLRKFCTNSTLLQMKIDREKALTDQTFTTSSTGEADETYSSSTLCPSQNTQPGERKVLGIQWDIPIDQFVICLEDVVINLPTGNV